MGSYNPAVVQRSAPALPSSAAPIGVFDSGIGGLSILRALRAQLPHESFVYLADSGHAPYGERGDAHVIARARALTHWLRDRGIGLLVVACNTATAAAIHLLRAEHPELAIVGVEPALKPALAASRTGRIGVMATRGTLASSKFGTLLRSLADRAEFVCQPCDGLADAIEQGVGSGEDSAVSTKLIALCREYTTAMGRFGTEPGEIDTLVLGCTHYPFAGDLLQALVGPRVALMDPGDAVARQAGRLLQGLRGDTAAPLPERSGNVTLCATGAPGLLRAAAAQWLALRPDIEMLHV
ncbi:MAG: Glutamate racemase [Burkholderiaceae bacterium]|jgi:glutamate racemase|nr:MAG: Glutamate racemase [Burkholderiaceae bacterium]